MKQVMIGLILLAYGKAHSQNVGIGITNPAANLHVDSVIKIGQNASLGPNTPGRINALRFGDGRFVSIGEDTRDDQLNIRAGMILLRQSLNSIGNGGVGIGVDSATAGLDLSGSLRLRTAGTPGVGKVLASDADGYATWQTPNNQNGIYAVGGSDFKAQSSDLVVDIFGGNGGAYYAVPATNSSLIAPVHLPNGVKVTEVTFWVVDNVAEDISLRFGGEWVASSGYGTSSNIVTTGASASLRSFTMPTNITINNAVSSYFVSAFTSWGGTNATLIKSVIIRYEY
ncbi:MAG: hypothetical protein V4722_09050 [Bacteroidota bacterium]